MGLLAAGQLRNRVLPARRSPPVRRRLGDHEVHLVQDRQTYRRADRASLEEEKYPLFVAEGESKTKLERIMHSGYLHKALRSFEACCAPSGNAVVVFGHSLAANDRHVLRCIAKGACSDLAVSLFGDPNSKGNREAITNALAIQAQRGPGKGKRPSLRLTFYDAASARVWG